MNGRSYFSALVGFLLFLAVMTISATGRAGLHAHTMHLNAEHSEMHIAHLHEGTEAHPVADATHAHESESHLDEHAEEAHS